MTQGWWSRGGAAVVTALATVIVALAGAVVPASAGAAPRAGVAKATPAAASKARPVLAPGRHGRPARPVSGAPGRGARPTRHPATGSAQRPARRPVAKRDATCDPLHEECDPGPHCNAGETFNPVINQCLAPAPACDLGYTFDPIRNQCLAPRPVCGPDETFDPIANRCNAVPPPPPCFPPLVSDGAGGCFDLTPTCTPPLVSNGEGQCFDPSPVCFFPLVSDGDGGCVLPAPTCTSPQVLDQSGTSCVDPPVATCDPPQVSDGAGGCVTPVPACDPPKTRDRSGDCVAPSVSNDPPALNPTTVVGSASAGSGQALTDTARVTGRTDPSDRATLHFALYGPQDGLCQGIPVFADTAPVPVDGGAVTSRPYTPKAPGTYRWIVSYSGDAQNADAQTTCGDPDHTVSVPGSRTSGAPAATAARDASAPAASPSTAARAGAAAGPARSACGVARAFSVRAQGVRITKATLTGADGRVRALRALGRVARVDLRGLAAGAYTLRLETLQTTGRTTVTQATYRTACS